MVNDAVNSQRRLSLETPFNKVLINKYLQFSQEIAKKYTQVFGWRYLFWEISASNSSFAVWMHGIFYLIDSILFFIGLIYLITSKKYKGLLFIVSMILVGAIPAVINVSNWFFFRSSFIIPFLIILAGSGLSYIFRKNKVIFGLTAVIYLISVLNFTFTYFVRYPIYASENIYFSPHILASYLSKIPNTKKVVVFENEPEFLFTSYLFYNNLWQKNNNSQIQQAYKQQNYQLENMQIKKCIPNNFKFTPDTIYIVDSNVDWCDDTKNKQKPVALFNQKKYPLYIKSIKDSGNDYAIYHDSLCGQPNNLSTFIHPTKLSQFNLNQLTPKSFYRTWITKPLKEEIKQLDEKHE